MPRSSSDTLFRIECFVESRYLGDVLTSLAGKVRSMSPPQPVINAKANGQGGPGVSSIARGDLIEMFLDWVKQHRLKEIRAKDAQDFLEEHGRSRGSSSYLLTLLKERRLAKHVGNYADGHWVLLKRPQNPKRDYAAERARAKELAAQRAKGAA